jgi:hypothetical protein
MLAALPRRANPAVDVSRSNHSDVVDESIRREMHRGAAAVAVSAAQQVKQFMGT